MDGSRRRRNASLTISGALVALGLAAMSTGAVNAADGASRTYTTTADFNGGTSNNLVTTTPNQLRLDNTSTAFPFIWVALSARGTIAKIDTATGEVLGEYSTTSDGDGSNNPSRTTVSNDGSAWAGNRSQSSVVHVGLVEAGQCVDRNGNGTIETSSGYGDVLAWPGGTGGASAPASDALDECILHYVDTQGRDARHVSVDAAGNVWVGSTSTNFQLISNATGQILRSQVMPCGGYGGLVDGNGVLWSANSGSQLLRWDPNAADEAGVNPRCLNLANYGLARDSQNNIWVAELSGGRIHKVSPDGNTIETFQSGLADTQGLAVDGRDHVWLSSSLFNNQNKIAHLDSNGALVGYVEGAGGGSTGVSVDSAEKIWTANINSSDATRIDPNAGPLGPDGVTRVGAFDLTVPLPGASPYNYSDMTGSTLTGKPASGTWTVIHDGVAVDAAWQKLEWTADTPSNSSLVVTVASSSDGVTFGPPTVVANGSPLSIANGRYLRIQVVFTRATTAGEESPVLYDLSINAVAAAPVTTAPVTTAPATTAPATTVPTSGVVPPAPPGAELPATGSSGSMTLTGLGLLLLGGAMMSLVRMRPARSD